MHEYIKRTRVVGMSTMEYLSGVRDDHLNGNVQAALTAMQSLRKAGYLTVVQDKPAGYRTRGVYYYLTPSGKAVVREFEAWMTGQHDGEIGL